MKRALQNVEERKVEPETPSAPPGPSSRQQPADFQEQNSEAAGRSNSAFAIAETQLTRCGICSEPVQTCKSLRTRKQSSRSSRFVPGSSRVAEAHWSPPPRPDVGHEGQSRPGALLCDGRGFSWGLSLERSGDDGRDFICLVLTFLLHVFALLQVFPGGCEVSWEHCDMTAEALTRG